MAEYIEKQAFHDAISEAIRKCPSTFYNGLETARRIAHNLPSADVQPVRHGRWIWDKDGMDWGIGAWHCSECKAMSPMWWNTDKTNPMYKSGHRYCPNCGCRMDGGNIDEH